MNKCLAGSPRKAKIGGVAENPPSSKRSGKVRKPASLPPPAPSSGMVQKKLTLGEKGQHRPAQPLQPQKAEAPGRLEIRTQVGSVPQAAPVPSRVEIEREIGKQGGSGTPSAASPAAFLPGAEPPPPVRIIPAPESASGASWSPLGERGLTSPSPPHPLEAAPVAPPPAKPMPHQRTEHRGRRRKAQGKRNRRPRGHLEEEEVWAGAQRMSLWWVLAGVVSLALLALLPRVFKGEAAEKLAAPKRVEESEGGESAPIAEFVSRSADLLPVVEDILERVDTSSDEELAKILRGGAEGVARRKQWRARNPIIARYRPMTERQLHAAAIVKTGYIVLAGLDRNYLGANAYFVKEDGDYRFDWEASEGFCEVLPGEVDQLADDEPRLMRATLNRSALYTPQFPEDSYRCYTLHHQDPNVFLYAFVERESPIDHQLWGSFRAPDLGGTRNRVTVRVRKGPEGARPNEVEVVEFLHVDWVEPME